MCLLTIERYETCQKGFSFCRLGHAPGVGLGGTVGGWGIQKLFFPNSTRFGVCVTYMNGTCNGTSFWVPASWVGPWGGAKRSNIIKSQLQSQFQRFFIKTLCVFSQMKDIKHIRRDFHSSPGSCMPQGLGLGGAGGQKFNVMNMVMWHIILKGMSSRPGYTENSNPRIKLVTLGRGQRIQYH